MTNDPTQLARAAANALWPSLQRRAWKPHTVKRAISPTGNPPSHRHSPGQIPGVEPTVEILTHEPYMWAAALADETRLNNGLVIHLTRAAHHAALARLSHDIAAEYEDALDNATCRAPFLYETVNGLAAYRRNHKDPLITDGVCTALQVIVYVADVRVLTPERARELSGPISLTDLLAVLERSSGA